MRRDILRAMPTLTEDQIQLLLSTISYVVDMFKLFYGCLLSVFVLQRCSNREDQICTLYDNFFELIPYNMFTLIFNFITIALLIGFYSIEYMREKWCITYLDHEENKPHDALANDMKRYPELLKKLIQYNYYYYCTACLSSVLVSLNILFSSILVTYYYYLDYRSVTTMITNSLLVVEKLYTSYKIAKSSNEEQCAISSYLILPIVYNQIDRDHRRPPSVPLSPPISLSPPRFRVRVCGKTFEQIIKLTSQKT